MGLPHGWCRTLCTDKLVNDEVFEGVFVKGLQKGPGILEKPLYNLVEEGIFLDFIIQSDKFRIQQTSILKNQQKAVIQPLTTSMGRNLCSLKTFVISQSENETEHWLFNDMT